MTNSAGVAIASNQSMRISSVVASSAAQLTVAGDFCP